MTDTNNSPQPTLYWHLTAEDQARMQDDLKITDDEGYLAHEINWGRGILDLRDNDYRENPTPNVDTTWVPQRPQNGSQTPSQPSSRSLSKRASTQLTSAMPPCSLRTEFEAVPIVPPTTVAADCP